MIGKIKKLFSKTAAFQKSLDTRSRIWFWTGIISFILCVLLIIFEPLSPFHAPFVFLLFGLSVSVIFILAHSTGHPVLSHVRSWISKHKFLTSCVVLVLLVSYSVYILIPLGKSPFSGLTDEELTQKVAADYIILRESIPAVDRTMRRFRAVKEILKSKKIEDISVDDRQKVKEIWADFLTQVMMYDRLVDEYRYFYRIFIFKYRFLHAKAFLTGYTAFVSRFLYSSELLTLIKNNSIWEKILDEPDTELGIPAGMYSTVKYNVVHVNDVVRLTAGYGHLQFLKGDLKEGGFLEREGEILTYVNACFAKSSGCLAKHSAVWFPKNGIDIFKKKTFAVWFPVQKAAARTTGHLRFTRRKKSYIDEDDIKGLKKALKPGDILVERRNWYLSNVGIPGFWAHAAIYTGNKKQIIEFFSEDEEIKKITGSETINVFMAANYPNLWNDLKDDKSVIESVEPGVVLHSLSESAGADYTAAIRPALSKKDRFLALCEAFSHYKKPYDFNFDFVTDSALVCTELVYKAYMPAQGKKGLGLELVEHAGRKLITANLIVEDFDAHFGTPEQQLDFVYFLDYDADSGDVSKGTLEDFRKSWERSKWSLFLER